MSPPHKLGWNLRKQHLDYFKLNCSIICSKSERKVKNFQKFQKFSKIFKNFQKFSKIAQNQKWKKTLIYNRKCNILLLCCKFWPVFGRCALQTLVEICISAFQLFSNKSWTKQRKLRQNLAKKIIKHQKLF